MNSCSGGLETAAILGTLADFSQLTERRYAAGRNCTSVAPQPPNCG